MSLRARLALAIGGLLAVALIAAGLVLVELTRAGLMDRVDRELRAIATSQTPLQRLATLSESDNTAGRSLAVVRLNRNGQVTLSLPSGFADSPDPLPALPDYTGGVPAGAYGQVFDAPSADGSMHYRVILAPGRLGAAIAIASPLAGVDDAIRTLVRFLLLVGVVTIGGVVALAWLVLRRGLRPVEQIAATAERISGGDLAQRSGVPHDGSEVGRLGAAFDTMLDQIQGAFAQQRAALAAREDGEARLRRFVADASHELRTPITSIRGYAELYRAGGLGEPAVLDAAMGRMESESRRMGALVDDLLLLARLDQGRPLRADLVDLSRLCEDAAADLRAADPERPVVAAVEPGVTVSGDEDRLRQVVGNLLANVRVHTPSATAVELFLRTEPDGAVGLRAEVRVVDHGPGIPAQDAAHVFDRFYRADLARSRETGGSGLGLSIAASIVAAHGGGAWHEATPGGGATFGFWLPITGSSQPTPGRISAGDPTL